MSTSKKTMLISEKEFLPILNTVAQDFFLHLNLVVAKSPNEWVKRHYSILSEKAHTLESLLDDYHARKNKTFSFLTELFASIKWFGYSASLQKHLLIRFPQYELDLSTRLSSEFIEESEKNLEWLHLSNIRLLEYVVKEANKLELELPQGLPEEIPDHDPLERKGLPHNIDEEEIVDQKHIVAEVATRFKNLAEEFRKIRVNKDVDLDNIINQTLYDFDETKSRHYESLIHNIQSKYDTYIQKTKLESKHPELAALRGYASLALHLFQMATVLVHFYERHESDIRYEKTKKQISSIIPKEDLLGVLHGYARYYGIKFFLEGEKHADRIIEQFIKIVTVSITPREEFCMHARPLSLIARVAIHYNTPLEIEIEGKSCNAGSIMQMILIAGDNPRPREILFRGEERALKDVKDLFALGFLDQIACEEVPHHLQYLFK